MARTGRADADSGPGERRGWPQGSGADAAENIADADRSRASIDEDSLGPWGIDGG